MEITPELRAAHEANRAAIDAAREDSRPSFVHGRRSECPCANCADQRWLDKRDEEFDDRWNARMNP